MPSKTAAITIIGQEIIKEYFMEEVDRSVVDVKLIFSDGEVYVIFGCHIEPIQNLSLVDWKLICNHPNLLALNLQNGDDPLLAIGQCCHYKYWRNLPTIDSFGD